MGHDSLRKASFSVFHNNICSLRRNLENLQTHILDELDFPFSIIGITETRITNEDLGGLNYNIPGYFFEYVPTPLSAGGVGVYIRDDNDYFLIEKASEVPYQTLWIEVIVPKKKNIFCCILYRQHNNPDRFLKHIDDKLEFYTSKGNPVFVLTDSNIDLLRINSCNYAHDFLLSLQSCSMLPTIDKPTRICRD